MAGDAMGRMILSAGRVLGMLSGGICSFLWISAIWFPTDGLSLEGAYLLPTSILMAVIGLVAAIAAYHGHSKVMLIGFIASFLPVGIALLDAEHFLRYAGMLNIVLAMATVLTAVGHRLESNQ
jgi:hypothetical protein